MVAAEGRMALKRKDNNKDRIKEGDQHPGRDPLDGAFTRLRAGSFPRGGPTRGGAGKISGLRYLLASLAARKG